MRRPLLLILVLGVSVLFAGCGSGGGSGGRTTTPAGSAVTRPSAAQLEARLLGVSDLAGGWKIGEPINPEDLASVGQSIPCPNGAVEPTVAKRLTAVTGIQFEPTDRTSQHMIELVITGDPAGLSRDLQALFAAMDSCAAAASGARGTAKLTVKRFEVPQLGDQQAGYLITQVESAPSQAPTWYIRNAIVRVGSVAVGFGLTEILGTPEAKPAVSDESFLQLLRTAVDKVRA